MICESHRENKTISQRIISILGTASEPDKIAALQEEGRLFLAQVKAARENPNKNLDPSYTMSLNTRELARQNVGIRDTLGTLYDTLGFSNILLPKVGKVLKSVVLSRFAEPSSKRKASFLLSRRFGEDVPLDSIYYMMDQLEDNLEKSQTTVFDATKLAVGTAVDLVLFDVTTLHMESTQQDEIRDFGYSKDNKVDTTQITLALATTQTGLPIGYKLFCGNTAEVSTLMQCIKTWRKTIHLGKIIVVGDRGMMSKDNITQLKAAGLEYIIAYPMKKSTTAIKEKILNKTSYASTVINNEPYLKQEIQLENDERLIVTFSEKRRIKDQKTRDKLIEKIKKRLGVAKQVKKLISNQGYIKFTKIGDETTVEMNEEKIIADAAWDGLHGIATNTTLSSEEVVSRYKNLWVIEEAFRINKHNLEMRPVYHYTPKRIKAHIEICFLTFALIKHAQYRLKQAGYSLSIDELREELSPLESSILHDRENGKLYRMPAHMTSTARAIYKILGKDKNLEIHEIDKQSLSIELQLQIEQALSENCA